MRTRVELALVTLRNARRMITSNLAGVSLDEALQSAGGYRSILGIVKHAAGWGHVYHSYAFEPAPRHWARIDWPRGLRDTIEPTQEYLDELTTWLDDACQRWDHSLSGISEEDLDRPYPCHWGASAPLFEIVQMVASHWCYHAGELNQILAVVRGQAWELSEEVEENHISTAGHRVRPDWMSDAQVQGYEAYLAKRDEELHGGAEGAAPR